MPATPTPLIASDGRALGATTFTAEATRRGAVAVLPGLAIPARFYRHLAGYLAADGFDVLTFDPRGIGTSVVGRVRDEEADLSDWVHLDYRAALGWLSEQPGPHLVVGHSLGGQTVGLLDEVGHLDGLYAVAAQLAYWRRYPSPTRYGMLGAFRLMPALARTFGYLPGWSGFGEDVPKGVIVEWCRWLNSPGYLLDHVEGAAARFARCRTPSVMLGFTDDTYAPPAGVEAIAACLPSSRTTLRIVDPAEWGQPAIGHFGGFRPVGRGDDAAPNPLWTDVREHLRGWAQDAGARAPQTG